MTRQEAINTLADLEEYFFYTMQNPEDLGEFYQSIQELHHNTRASLEKFHRITGLKPE